MKTTVAMVRLAAAVQQGTATVEPGFTSLFNTKDDEWFTQTITVVRDTITVKVNDKQVVNWTQPADWNGGAEGPGRRITGPGTIALQAHDPKGTVFYKNIRIKPLD